MKKLKNKNVEEILALTPVQEGMLFHYLKDPDTTYYFEQLSLEIPVKIDAKRFEKSWNFVIESNEMLRTVFRWEKIKTPTQVILKEYALQWSFHDLSGMDPGEKEKYLEIVKARDRENRFDLRDVPFRVTLCKNEETLYTIIVSYHHILLDGWSCGIVLKEFFKAYNCYANGNVPLKSYKTRFNKFIKWSRDRDAEGEKRYWQEYLAGSEPLALSIKRQRRVDEAPVPGSMRFLLDVGFKKQVEQFAGKNRLTLGALFYCAWGILLQKYNNTGDVVFGTTVSGREITSGLIR